MLAPFLKVGTLNPLPLGAEEGKGPLSVATTQGNIREPGELMNPRGSIRQAVAVVRLSPEKGHSGALVGRNMGTCPAPLPPWWS